MSKQNATPRIHIVLIPGFGGFDALGQLEYYAGVTPLFHSMRDGNAVLHYFDNFPTAAVITRAARLRSYLAKRIARSEILPGDEVVLIGHSTGACPAEPSSAKPFTTGPRATEKNCRFPISDLQLKRSSNNRQLEIDNRQFCVSVSAW
jgi:hypothetical protein